jgi:L-iditol 2-dehydrogenase
MKTMIWRGDNNFTLENVEIPNVIEGTCLIKIHTAGVCGTDVHITQGLFPSHPNVALGHEFSGEIVEIGKNVDKSLLNQEVSAHTVGGCGTCESCRKWSVGHCEKNQRRAGAFSEYVLSDAKAISVIPENLSLENASLAEPASCSLSCVEMLRKPKSKSTAVVIGNGLLGLFTIFFLKLIGIDRIISSEIEPSRRALANEFGSDVSVDPAKNNLLEIVKEETNGYGADIVAEAVGNPKVLKDCFQLIRPRGQMLLVGVNPKGSKLPFDLFDMHFNEISVFGAFGAGNSFERALNHLPNMALDKIISGRFPLQELPEAIRKSANAEGIKFVIGPND